MTIRVLLADDHALVRDGLRLILSGQRDLEVVAETGSGREAVALAAALAPDVVLMDIAMPDLNGIEATARLRQACPAARVVVLSMHATSEHLYRAFAAGASGYLVKESAGAEVVHAIRAVRSGRRYLSRVLADGPLGDTVLPAAEQAARSPLERLSPREREILQLVVEGHSSAAIGSRLRLSPKTVETYRSRLMAKLGLGDLPSLVRFAVSHGLTP